MHSHNTSKFIAVAVTITLELLFALLGGITLYYTFVQVWPGLIAFIISVIAGVTFLGLSLYTFIWREYAVEAIKVFSKSRGENASERLFWALFLVVVVILMETFFNLERISSMDAVHLPQKIFLGCALELLIFVPFALGKLVHAHVNVNTTHEARITKLTELVDSSLHAQMKREIPSMKAHELLALGQGDVSPLHSRMQVVDEEKEEAKKKMTNSHPLAQALRQSLKVGEKETN